MGKLRVVFMGTPDFACPTLQKLLDRGEEVIAVVTQPDRPKGRGQKMVPPPVKELAEKNGIPVLQPQKVRAPEFIEILKGMNPDLIVVVAFGQILPKALLDIPKFGCINVHASLLPRYRGAAPLNWCIINGETETGVTTMLMDEGLDTGAMLLKKVTPIDPEEDTQSLHDRLSAIGADTLSETLDMLAAGGLNPVFLDDVEAGLDGTHTTAEAIHDRNTVQQHVRRADLHPVDARVATAFDARSEVKQVADNPSVQRKLLDAGALHDGPVLV